ncbi:MAG TPA: tetratricopeptide repeat protein [Polyangia bacterium]|jgi:tetratricopeptide (TPR) repeat protein|nr:tetratricopeptide repeat protein [Polyangia bacterium]
MFVLFGTVHPAHAEEPPTEQAKREAKLHFDLGTAYFNAGKYDLAIAEYEKAYQLHHAPLLLFNLGQTCRKKGDRVAAIRYYQEFLKADTASSRSAEARKFIEALEREQAQAVREESKVHFDKATALYNAGKYDDAIAEYEAAHRILPVPDLDFYVAQALRKKGDRRRALQRYRQYLAAPQQGAKSVEAKRSVDELEGEERAEREAAAKARATSRGGSPSTTDRASHPTLPPQPAVNPSVLQSPTEAATRPPRRSLWRAWAGVIAGGVAIAGVGGLLQWRTSRDFAAYDRGILDCSERNGGQGCVSVPPDVEALRARGRTLQNVAFVAYGVGGAGIVTGIVLLGVDRRNAHREAQTASPPSLSLAPFLGPGQAGVVTTLRF